MSNSGPVKCKTCGVAEWNHVCYRPDKRTANAAIAAVSSRGLPISKGAEEITVGIKRAANKAPVLVAGPVGKLRKGKTRLPVVRPTAVSASDKNKAAEPVTDEMGEKQDRNEYIKLKMRERRSAAKLGLTVAEYRKQHANE